MLGLMLMGGILLVGGRDGAHGKLRRNRSRNQGGCFSEPRLLSGFSLPEFPGEGFALGMDK